jgi:hypothetical protein
MPRYWILCMSEDNYEIAKKQGLTVPRDGPRHRRSL